MKVLLNSKIAMSIRQARIDDLEEVQYLDAAEKVHDPEFTDTWIKCTEIALVRKAESR